MHAVYGNIIHSFQSHQNQHKWLALQIAILQWAEASLTCTQCHYSGHTSSQSLKLMPTTAQQPQAPIPTAKQCLNSCLGCFNSATCALACCSCTSLSSGSQVWKIYMLTWLLQTLVGHTLGCGADSQRKDSALLPSFAHPLGGNFLPSWNPSAFVVLSTCTRNLDMGVGLVGLQDFPFYGLIAAPGTPTVQRQQMLVLQCLVG